MLPMAFFISKKLNIAIFIRIVFIKQWIPAFAGIL